MQSHSPKPAAGKDLFEQIECVAGSVVGHTAGATTAPPANLGTLLEIWYLS